MSIYNYRLFDHYKRMIASFAVLCDESLRWRPKKFSYQLIDWVMQLPKHLEIKFRNELQAYEEATHMRYITSIERIGMEKGMEKGLQQGALRQLVRLLQHHFQTMPEAVQTRLDVLPV